MGLWWWVILGVMLGPTHDPCSTGELPPQEGKTGELWRGGLCQGPCIPFHDALPWATPIYYYSSEKHRYPVYTQKNIFPWKLGVDAISPNRASLIQQKFCNFIVVAWRYFCSLGSSFRFVCVCVFSSWPIIWWDMYTCALVDYLLVCVCQYGAWFNDVNFYWYVHCEVEPTLDWTVW